MTSARTGATSVRRLPLPDAEPPYDDEVETSSWRGRSTDHAARDATVRGPQTQGTLALAFQLPSGLPATPEPPANLRLVGPAPWDPRRTIAPGPRPTQPGGQPTPAPRVVTGGGRSRVASTAPDEVVVPFHPGMDDERIPEPTSRCELPDPRGWVARLVQGVLEVVSGDRPVTQLTRWTSADVYADLHRRVSVAARTAPPGLRGGRRAAVRSVHVCEPVDGVAEASAVVSRGGRLTAMAVRLEGLDGRWQCTALELG